ncbi:MAG: VPLPA-CTERM-specific exosortase XrtD [Pseudomonadota bacterium]
MTAVDPLSSTDAPLKSAGHGAGGDLRNPVALGLLAAAVLATVILFWDAIGNLWARWGEQEELSHSYFIPVISGWLVWINRDNVLKSVGDPSWLGLWLALGAAFWLLLGRVTESFLFQQIGLVVAIAGLTAGFGGASLLRATAAPIGFLLFAVPPPYMLITILSWKFQEMSSIIGVGMLEALGVPVFLSGNIIDLGDYQLQVAEACSGLRYLFPFLSLGIMTAYIYRGPLWQKALIVISTVPITILMNSFRIAVTGLLVQNYGTEHAEGALHFFEGWVVFLLCMVALFAVVALLGFIARPRLSAVDALGSPELPAVAPSKAGASRIGVPVMATIVVVFAVSFAAARFVGVDNLIVPERTKFASLPSEFEGWGADVKKLSPLVADVIGADDTIVVDMVSPDGDFVNLYLAYLEARRDGRSWHSPSQCIPGGGWGITQHTVETGATPTGAPLNYNRLVIQNGPARQLVYYWYPQRGRHIANEFVMRLWLTVDAVSRRRSDGAMVRLMTPLDRNEPMAVAEARLQSMMDRLGGHLPEYVPE